MKFRKKSGPRVNQSSSFFVSKLGLEIPADVKITTIRMPSRKMLRVFRLFWFRCEVVDSIFYSLCLS